MDNLLSRRSFLSSATLFGAGVAASALTGCAPKGSETTTPTATSSSETTSGPAIPGLKEVEHNPQGTETCDIVVVGTGTAGMCASVRAAELGAKVICLEKNAGIGGSSGAAEGIGGVGSYWQKEHGIDINANDVFLDTQAYHHWAANSEVLHRFIDESGATVDWLHDSCGVNFVTSTIVSPVSYRTWHLAGLPGSNTPERNQSTILDPMKEYGVSLGVDYRLSSPATGLIYENNRVKGVYFSNNEGEFAIEATKAVILATGGYSNNPEMFEFFAHVPFDRIHNWGVPGRDGDGIGWAVSIGAATHIPSAVMYSCTGIPDTPAFEDKANWVFSWQPNLRVNQDASRFVNEFNAPDFALISNSVLCQTRCFSIMDQSYVDMINDVALPIGLDSLGYITGKPLEGARKAVEAAVEAGRAVKADTIEDLAQQLGLDAATLSKTMGVYNDYCKDGVDPEFGAPKDVLIPIAQPPYYAAEILPACFTSVGGLNVNADLQVLREDGSVINGLYALGGDASSDTGRDYDVAIMPGSQQGWCATGGRLAAEHILG